MALCVNEIRRLHGGIVVAYDGEIVGCLPLPSPFMTQSFLVLPVIPLLKITDLGLVDVERHEIVDVIRG